MKLHEKAPTWRIHGRWMLRGELVEHLIRNHAKELRAELGGAADTRRMSIALLKLSGDELCDLHAELDESAADVIDLQRERARRSNTSTGQRAGASPRPSSPPGSSGSGSLGGFIDDLDRVVRETPELIGDAARPLIDVVTNIVDALYEAWVKLTGLPKFALLAYVYLEMVKRDGRDERRRR